MVQESRMYKYWQGLQPDEVRPQKSVFTHWNQTIYTTDMEGIQRGKKCQHSNYPDMMETITVMLDVFQNKWACNDLTQRMN